MAAALPPPRFSALASGVPIAVERVFQCALLGMLASGYFALLGTGFLDWPTAIITLAALCARALMVAGILKLDLPTRAIAALTIAYAGFFPLDYLYVSRSLLSAMVHLIARLGGYVERPKSEPGAQTVWIGLQRMYDLAWAWDSFGPGAKVSAS